MLSWLGLFATGLQTYEGMYCKVWEISYCKRLQRYAQETLLAEVCPDAVSEKLCKPSPTIVRLNVVRESKHNKCVSSAVSHICYRIHKVQLLSFGCANDHESF